MGCEAIRYEEVKKSKEYAMKGHCFNFDKMAVRCFNHRMFNVEVDLEVSNRRATCGIQVRISLTEHSSKTPIYRGFWGKETSTVNRGFACLQYAY